MELLGPVQVRQLASDLNIRPTKKLGQNFVIDANTVRKIVRDAELEPGEHVLEIGPGVGSLTLGLLEAGVQVTAIEIDPVLAQALPSTVTRMAPEQVAQFQVVEGDALAVELSALASPSAAKSGNAPPTALVANLPYNVSVPVLLRILAECPTITRALVMVQAEVADRLVAAPGSRTYGVPSVKLQWFGSARKVGSVSPHVFWPAPRVDSGLVRFDRGLPPQCESNRTEVFACIDAAFSQRRKSLRSALANWAGSLAQADQILELAGISASLRGEVLRVGDFAAITDARCRLLKH